MDEELLDAIKQASRRIAFAITADAAPGPGATGGVVGSLTEAVMDMASSMVQVATAIDGLADAIRDMRAE